MRLPILFTAVLLVGLAVPAGPARADCDGFTDVTDFICSDVRWLKNRQITLGCTSTLYCPDTAVTRLQMAAFMNRLGNVVTPIELFAEGSGGALAVNTLNYVCQTPAVAALKFRRTLIGTASLSFDVTGLPDVGVAIVQSTDGGATWESMGTGHHDFFTAGRGNATQRQHVQAMTWNEYLPDPNVGFAPRYAIAVGGGTINPGTVASWTCQLQITLNNGAE